MKAPEFPADEAARILALQRTNLLDTPAEQRFDRITKLAASVFQVPICLISLVDSDRQWFKSKVGLDACETGRDISFCGHAILHDDLLIVSDATKDERFASNPLVTHAPHIRFYAGAPLREPSGQPIGTLCLIDSKTRDFSAKERQELREFADMVEYEIAKVDQEQLQEQFLKGVAKTNSILATLPDMVFVIDRNFRFLVCKEHPDLLKPQQAILGRTVLEVLPNELGHQLVECLKQAFCNNDVIQHNYTFEKSNQSFEARYKKIDDNEVLVVIRNTTAQVAAQSEINRLSEVAKQTTNGIVITDIDGRVIWVNDAFSALTGYRFEEIQGRKPGELLQGPDTDPATVSVMREALKAQKSFSVDILNYKKTQDPFWVRVSCNPLMNEEGNITGYIAVETDITKQKKDEALILNSKNLLTAVIDANRIGTWHFNLLTGELNINDHWAAIIGYRVEELSPVSKSTWERLLHPDDLAHCLSMLDKYVHGVIPVYEATVRMKHKNGRWVWIYGRGSVTTWSADGKPEWMLGTHFDINNQVRTERALHEKSRQMEAVVEGLLDGIITIDSRGKVLTFNQAAEKIFGYTREEMFGKNISLLMDSPHREHHDCYLSNYIKRGISDITGRIRELEALHKDGTVFPIELGVVEVQMAGEINFIGIVRDITERKQQEREINQLAFYDPLTGLPNRRLLLDRIERVLHHCDRANHFAALLFLDLDNFKHLNDSKGHGVGDLLLCQVAKRLTNCLRQGDTVARMGGDEFVILLSDLSHDEDVAMNHVQRLAKKIINNFTKTYNLNGINHNSSASIGVTIFNSAKLTKEDLLKQADMAMYKAKNAGRNGVQFYEPQMQVAVTSRAEIISDLYCAIQSQQFVLFYQKQVNHLEQCIGVEVLLRWMHPEKGMVSPLQFIPLAEETGLIAPIGEWVLQQACATLAKWSLVPEKQHLSIAVNISVVQFSKDNFVQTVINAIEMSGANPHRLKLEITESLLVNNIADVKAKMQALQQHGVTFSIDDFGTGYSSLSYLKQLPIDQLKIDQGFVKDIIDSSNDRAIAQAVITLADSMSLQVIAEGVETEAQRALLKSMGCNSYQGYLYSRPCRLEDLSF